MNIFVVGLISIVCCLRSYGMDPFSVMAVASSATGALRSISETSAEISNTADAFNELYSEIDSEAQVSNDAAQMVKDIQETEELAYEAGYTKDEVESVLSEDQSTLEKLSDNLRHMARAVRAAKRVHRLTTRLKERAEMAEVESASLEREQMVATYRSIRLMYQERMDRIKEELKAQLEKKRQAKEMSARMKSLGARQFGGSGVTTFPSTKKIIERAILGATKYRAQCFSLITLILFMRIVFYQFSLSGVRDYGDLMRDAAIGSLMLYAFPELLRIIFSISETLPSILGEKNLTEMPDFSAFKLELGFGTPAWVSNTLLQVFTWIKFGAFQLASFLTSFGISILILLLPIVIVLGQMLNVSIAMGVIFGSILVLSMWPLVWNVIGYTASLGFSDAYKAGLNDVSAWISSILLTVTQVLSPIVGVKLMSGGGIGEAITSGVKTVMNPAQAAFSSLQRNGKAFAQSATGQNSNGVDAGSSAFIKERPSAPLGKMSGYAINQSLSRGLSAVRSYQDVRSKDDPSSGYYVSNSKVSDRLKRAALGFAFNESINETSRTPKPKELMKSLNSKPILKKDEDLLSSSPNPRSQGTAFSKREFEETPKSPAYKFHKLNEGESRDYFDPSTGKHITKEWLKKV